MTQNEPQDGATRHPVPHGSLRREAKVHAATVAGARRPMRRADREVLDPTQIADILQQSHVVHVAYEDAEGQTVVPVNFAYEYRPYAPNDYDADGRGRRGELTLYMHSALEGRKVDAIRAAGNALPVAFEMDCDQVIYTGRTPCASSTAFRSLVGTGTASLMEDGPAKRDVLTMLATRLDREPSRPFTDRQAGTVAVWRIDSGSFPAKHHPLSAL
ncbi:MAG: pyridoxamine 5'-phosphate oxidase family protein [Bifidobacterium sp.]|nr:pyridoxamine 5'-phosphate oxidase family protein [Bifidobacterium sp.]